MQTFIGFKDALDLTLSNVSVGKTEFLPLSRLTGKILAEDVVAKVDCPSVSSSRKDGYAVVSSDVSEACSQAPVTLKVVGSLVAGSSRDLNIKRGQAVRITTGAPLPGGADAVLSEEFCRREKNAIIAHNTAEAGRNIHVRGRDIRRGETVAEKGGKLTPARIGLLAAAGLDGALVYKSPRVSVIATGDEVVLPGEPLRKGQLYASNMVTLCAWLDIPAGGAVDGFFDPADGQCQTTNAANPTLTFQWAGLPTDQQYMTFARFRLTTGAMTAADSVGPMDDGEVEDYPVTFDFTPTAVTIGSVALDALPVTGFLVGLDTDTLNRDALLGLLAAWDGESAAALAGAGRDTILTGLQDFLDPDGDGQVAVLRWDTLEERGTVGFYVERREDGGSWSRINGDLLPGLIDAPLGGEYQLADPSAQPGGAYQYRLIEQEATGNTRNYGPFDVVME